ncbi:MAG: hypothetical protein O2856_04320 [Planctomycetota bacterium]|nr:hypothetical protein [Planctomycetota bacterium]
MSEPTSTHIRPAPESIVPVGVVERDNEFEWILRSSPIDVPLFDNKRCTFEFKRYCEDPNPTDLSAAVSNFLTSSRQPLIDSEEHIWAYYKESKTNVFGEHCGLTIEGPADLWAHIQFGDTISVSRRKEDHVVYLSIECECDWAREHGLQIVFKDGRVVSKVGGYNGHLANPEEGVVYRSRFAGPPAQ